MLRSVHRISAVGAAVSALMLAGTAVPDTAVASSRPVAAISLSPTRTTVDQRVTANISKSRLPHHDTLRKIVVRWGDGSKPSRLTKFSERAHHRYVTPNHYTVTVKITDKHGRTATAKATEVVVAPPGRYSGQESQNGNGLSFYVSADHRSIQDFVIPLVGLSCSGGFGTGGPLIVDSMSLRTNGSFSISDQQSGAVATKNLPTVFTIKVTGNISGVASPDVPKAAGTYVETAAYSDSGAKSCTSGPLSWSVTRDNQPKQPPGVGAAGTYRGQESQNGNGLSFSVATNRSAIQNLDVPLVGLNCYGGGGISTPINLSSLILSTNGSFTKTFAEASNNVSYSITFQGHFHGVDGTGAPRAAGSYRVTGTYSQSGTEHTCVSGKQWWYAARTGS